MPKLFEGWILTHQYCVDYRQYNTGFLEDHKCPSLGDGVIRLAYLRGTNENRKHYLSTKEYASLAPLNGHIVRGLMTRLSSISSAEQRQADIC